MPKETAAKRDQNLQDEPLRYFTPSQRLQIRALLEQIGHGDEAAKNKFISLVRKPFAEPLVKKIGEKLLGEGTVDEDVVADVVNDILSAQMARSGQRACFRGETNSWVSFYRDFHSCVTNEFKARRTAQKKMDELVDNLGTDERMVARMCYPQDARDPQDVLAVKQRDRALYEAINRLRSDDAKILQTRIFDDATLEVAGEAVGISRMRASQRESKALKALLKDRQSDGFADRVFSLAPQTRGIE